MSTNFDLERAAKFNYGRHIAINKSEVNSISRKLMGAKNP
jgi:hypothetical protein